MLSQKHLLMEHWSTRKMETVESVWIVSVGQVCLFWYQWLRIKKQQRLGWQRRWKQCQWALHLNRGCMFSVNTLGSAQKPFITDLHQTSFQIVVVFGDIWILLIEESRFFLWSLQQKLFSISIMDQNTWLQLLHRRQKNGHCKPFQPRLWCNQFDVQVCDHH